MSETKTKRLMQKNDGHALYGDWLARAIWSAYSSTEVNYFSPEK
jgi:hypothetical protein